MSHVQLSNWDKYSQFSLVSVVYKAKNLSIADLLTLVYSNSFALFHNIVNVASSLGGLPGNVPFLSHQSFKIYDKFLARRIMPSVA